MSKTISEESVKLNADSSATVAEKVTCVQSDMNSIEDFDPDDYIHVGDWIVIQKQNYKRLHKFNKIDSTVNLGRDTVSLAGIQGYPYFSIFKMLPTGNKGRLFKLEETEEVVGLKDEIEIKTSGADNRDIIDDGKSQKLSSDEIRELATENNKAADIVEILISNSNTFHNKTEYSQEKYLKKKEKKYFDYLQILRPSIRIIADIMYKLEPNKIQNLRLDTLSQIMCYSNVHAFGVHLLYDSGSNGLVAAALMDLIGRETEGKLIHMHPGNMSQKQALLAMNYPDEQYNRCISVNIYSVLRQMYQGCDTHQDKSTKNSTDIKSSTEALKRKAEDDIEHKSKVAKTENNEDVSNSDLVVSTQNSQSLKENTDENSSSKHVENGLKINGENTERSEPKKPKWHFDNLAAAELLKEKVDSLVITCKEDPLNIFLELMQFVKPSRPFVVYYPVAEPLQNMYVALKPHPRVCALKLTCNWMRNYQVLPERTHPEVMMNNQSGFLLTGYILK